MANVRVYELAHDLGIEIPRAVELLRQVGAEPRNHMSIVERVPARRVRQLLKQNKNAAVPRVRPSVAPTTIAAPPAKPVSLEPEKAEAAPVVPETQPELESKPEPKPEPTPKSKPESAAAAAPAPKVEPKPIEAEPASPVSAEKPPVKRDPASAPKAAAPSPPSAPAAEAPPAADKAPRPTSTAKAEAARPARRAEAESGARTAARQSQPEAEQRPAARSQRPAANAAATRPAAGTAESAARRRPAQSGERKGAGRAGARPAAPGARSAGRNVPGAAGGARRSRGRQGAASKAARDRQAAPAEVRPTGPLVIPESITVQELAERLHLPATALIKNLMAAGVMASINQSIDHEAAAAVAEKLGFEVARPEAKRLAQVSEADQNEDALVPRPPVVTILGHVDHGKTTLLDVIRETKVVEKEAGGITQHIGAYQVEVDGKKITFLDTPGHEAFTEMRSRGAQVTDIAILVVAADDGVMPQTVEALNHAKAADVPIIVAINKMDRPGANPDLVKQQLTEHELVPEEWGGDTICVPISALNNEGIDDLLEMVLLVAELKELKANPDRPAQGIVVEAELDKSRGPVATILVQTGTLRTGDSVVVGTVYGRVRAMFDEAGEAVAEAGPSRPVGILGLSDVPRAGDRLEVLPDDRAARQLAMERSLEESEQESQRGAGRLRLSEIFAGAQQGEVKDLNLVLKADGQGSVEALQQSVEKLSTPEVRVNVIHAGVGGINESDVALASASDAIIIGFNVRPETTARRSADREGVEVRTYRVIYEAIEEIKAAILGLLDPEYEEEVLGRAEVRELFKVPNVGMVAGCYVVDGKILRQAEARLIRDGVVVHEGKLGSLKRFKDDVREVNEGYECGISFENFDDLKHGDIIEAYHMKEVKREA